MFKLSEKVEAVLLTGGASRRMGKDKASILIEGEPLADRIARLIGSLGIPITVLGRSPISAHGFLADPEEFAGPLAALARFKPTREFIFVSSCDIPGFNAQIIQDLSKSIGSHQAAVCVVDHRLQPLCSLYRADAFPIANLLVQQGEHRVMKWLDQLQAVTHAPADPDWARNVNYPEELERFR